MSSLQRTPPAVAGTQKVRCDILNGTPLTNKRLRTDDQDWGKTESAESNVNPSSITLENMMGVMMQQFTETRQLIDAVRSEIQNVNNKIDTVKTELQCDIKSVKAECAAKFQHHDAALDLLNKQVNSVSQKIGTLANRNELIISGIPSVTGENLNLMLRTIGNHLALKDTTALMAEARRMKSGSNSNSDGLIVVEFALKATRDEFYGAYLRRRDLRLKHIGLDSDRRVYINESLTIEARKLKSAALHLKKAGKLASVYTKQGIVHVKTAANGPSIVIQSEEELEKYS